MLDMTILSLVGYIAGALGLAGSISAAVVMVRSTASKQTIDSQRELIDALLKGKEEQKDQIFDLQQKHIGSIKAIADLQGQLTVLKNVPLQQIADDMKSIAVQMDSISKNQHDIVAAFNKVPTSTA